MSHYWVQTFALAEALEKARYNRIVDGCFNYKRIFFENPREMC